MANDAFTLALNDAIHDRVIEFVESEPRGRLLDVGAGDGTLTRRLQSAGFTTQIVDLFTQDVRVDGIPIDVADLNQGLPYGGATFDVITCTEVIEHLENPWYFLRELHRILKPGGLVVLSTPNLSNLYTRLYFLLTGRLYNFGEASYRQIGHITPIYLWNLRRMAEGLFNVEHSSVNASPVPKLHVLLPSRSRLLGQCDVVALRRNHELATRPARLTTDSRLTRD